MTEEETGRDVLIRFDRMLNGHICPSCGGLMEDLSEERILLVCPKCGEAWEEPEEPEDDGWDDFLEGFA